MKLIELLVQELPKRGGWPDGAIKITQDYDKEAWAWFGDDLNRVRSLGRLKNLADNHRLQSTDESPGCFVYRDQYEAALAAAQPQWDGEGLPSVGCECQIILGKDGDLGACEVIFMGSQIVVWRQKSTFAEGSGILRNVTFRPICSEADKKRDEAVAKLTDAICGSIPDTGMATAANYAVRAYDAIAAGKIPHVHIE